MIYLYHYKNNFGDELSPYIIHKLSGQKIKYTKPFTLKNYILDFLRFLKKIIFKRKIDKSLIAYYPFKKVIVSIGSILQESTSNSIVWGAGLANRTINIKGGKFIAVRGPLSQKRLSELNYNPPKIVGDPAILLPIIYQPKKKQELLRTVGIIPHKVDYLDITSKIPKDSDKIYKIINLEGTNIEDVIDEITSCQFIYSSSLHGLIVAHTYNIPALRFINNKLSGDDSKFIDYFLSVNLEYYEPFSINQIEYNNLPKLELIFEEMKNYSLPHNDLNKMQINLLMSAPFEVIINMPHLSK